jgi:hypothetical protein
VELYGPQQAADGFILVSEPIRAMRPGTWTARWRRLDTSTDGVRDDHTLHAVRHSRVNSMRNSGVPDHVAAAWHGHHEVGMRKT